MLHERLLYYKINIISCWYKLQFNFPIPNELGALKPFVLEITLIWAQISYFWQNGVLYFCANLRLTTLFWIFQDTAPLLFVVTSSVSLSLLASQFPLLRWKWLFSTADASFSIADYRSYFICQYTPYLLYPSEWDWHLWFFFLSCCWLLGLCNDVAWFTIVSFYSGFRLYFKSVFFELNKCLFRGVCVFLQDRL